MNSGTLLDVLRANGAATEDEVRAVLDRQADLGGGLDTCLLELSVVDEGGLLRALGQATGLPPVDIGRLLHARSEAVRRLPRPVALRYEVMPFEVVDGTVHLAVTTPPDDEAKDVLHSRLRSEARLFVAPEVRLASALALHYLVPLSDRLASLAYTLGVPPVPASTGDDDSGEAVAPEPARPASELLPEALTDARDRMLAATERDEIVDIALAFGRTRFPCVAAFALVGGRIQGHDVRAEDPEVNRARVRRIKVSTAWRSVFRTVLETGGHYLGPVPDTELDRLLVADLGRGRSRRILVAPVAVRGRPVLVLYADGGEAGLDPEIAAEWLLLTSAMPAAFERVLRARKLAELGGEVAETPAPVAEEAVAPAAEASAIEAPNEAPTVEPPPAAPLEPPAPRGPPPLPAAARRPPAEVPATEVAPPPPAVAPAPAAEPMRSVPTPATDADLQRDVGRLLAGGPGAGAALERVVARGHAATDALARLFPGPLKIRVHSVAEMPDDPFAHGPVIAAMARIGPAARPALLRLATSRDNAARRLYAVVLLGRIPGAEGLEVLGERLFDPDPMVTVAARDALRAHQGVAGYEAVVAGLRADLGRLDQPGRLLDAIRALAHLRDREAVPRLVHLLGHGDREVVREAEHGLTAITKQAFGTSGRRWNKWLETNGSRPRFEWLIEGLKHKDRTVRLSASEDLERLTGESFGYYFDGRPKDRAEAVAKWEAWWRAQEA